MLRYDVACLKREEAACAISVRTHLREPYVTVIPLLISIPREGHRQEYEEQGEESESSITKMLPHIKCAFIIFTIYVNKQRRGGAGGRTVTRPFIPTVTLTPLSLPSRTLFYYKPHLDGPKLRARNELSEVRGGIRE